MAAKMASTRKPSTPRPNQKRIDLGHRLGHGRVAPVQVRLLRVEGVEVVLLAWTRPTPRSCRRRRPPSSTAGRRAGAGSAQMYQSRLGLVARRAALDEPRMLDRGVARHEIEQEAQPARVAGLDQRVEVGQRPVLGRDVGVVADVVAEVVERRGIHRREPDGVDAEGRIGPGAGGRGGRVMPRRSPMPSPFASA